MKMRAWVAVAVLLTLVSSVFPAQRAHAIGFRRDSNPPVLSSFWSDESHVSAGESFEVWYDVRSEVSTTVWLGISLFPTSGGTPIHDPQHDVPCGVVPLSSSACRRSFTVPPDTPVGSYTLHVAIWSGEPPYATMYDIKYGQVQVQTQSLGQVVARRAEEQIGVRYVYGCETPAEGFDCSGLVWYVYRQVGVEVPRKSSWQAEYGRSVLNESWQPGDVLVFDMEGQGVDHVGIYVGDNQFVHAVWEKQVQKVSLDQWVWRQKLHDVRRFL